MGSESLQKLFDSGFTIFYKISGLFVIFWGIFWVINGFMGSVVADNPLKSDEHGLDRESSIKFGFAVLIFLAISGLLVFLFSP